MGWTGLRRSWSVRQDRHELQPHCDSEVGAGHRRASRRRTIHPRTFRRRTSHRHATGLRTTDAYLWIPPTPAPTLTPMPTDPTNTNDLPALLPTLADIAPGAIIGGEGYVEDTDALLTYEREFEAEGLFFTLGLSQLSNLSSTVEMYATSSDASAPVLVMRAMDPQLFAQLAGPAFAEGAGFSSENVVVEAIDLPAIGDATAGFLMKAQTAAINLDVYMLWFAQGRIAAQLIAGGPRGQVHSDDVARIARLIDQRIIERIDNNPPRTPLATPTPTQTRSATQVPMPTPWFFLPLPLLPPHPLSRLPLRLPPPRDQHPPKARRQPLLPPRCLPLPRRFLRRLPPHLPHRCRCLRRPPPCLPHLRRYLRRLHLYLPHLRRRRLLLDC